MVKFRSKKDGSHYPVKNGKKSFPDEKTRKLDDKYLNNGYFYFTCNECDRLIEADEMTVEEYNKNGGYCPEHKH